MSKFFTLTFSLMILFAAGQPFTGYDDSPAGVNHYGHTSYVTTSLPYLRDCRTVTTDAERYRCTVDELMKVLENEFECPWKDLDGDLSRMVLRFFVNTDGSLERFLTLFSDNTANRAPEPLNNALIRAVHTTSGRWTPVRESGRSIPGEFVLPVACNCSNDQKPVFQYLDTVPAYYADGYYQLESFIQQHIVYPDGFLSRSGRQTVVLLKAMVSEEGKLDSSSIRVINLNSIDYRLSENAINILVELGKKPWRPATFQGNPIQYELYFKVTYVDDRNPRRGSIPTEWDIIIGNSHLYNDGVNMFNNKEYASAIELFKRAVYLDPEDRDSWLMLGQSYIGNRNNALARDAIQKAIDLEHPDAEKWMDEAQKPEEVAPALPEKEVRKRPTQTDRVRPQRGTPVLQPGAQQPRTPQRPQRTPAQSR